MLIVDSTWNGRGYKKMRCLVIVPKTGAAGHLGTYLLVTSKSDGASGIFPRLFSESFGLFWA